MATLSNKSSNGNPMTDAQLADATNAVNLCDAANKVSATDSIADISKLKNWTIVWNGQQTTDANYAYIALDPTQQIYVLAIRGSLVDLSNLLNWSDFANWILEDFSVVKQISWPYASTPNAKISKGAYLGFKNLMSMWNSLESILSVTDYLVNNAIKQGKRVIITGHSLGGNIANVYTSYFMTILKQVNLPSGTPPPNVSLYTFAAPAPGNGDFAKDLDTKLPTAWHFQSDKDVIPNFPVPSAIQNLATWYSPDMPDATLINVIDLNGKPVFLNQAINDLAALLILTDILNWSNYKQQANNYTTFSTAKLLSQFQDNNLKFWFMQVLMQHQLYNYAGYLAYLASLEPATQYA